MMNALLPSPVISLLLFVVWLVLNNSIAPGHILLALLLGWGIPLLTSRLQKKGPALKKPHKMLTYLLMVLWDIVVANFQVARLILGPKRKLDPGFVKVPLELSDALPMTILASTVSLTPGTVSADVLKQDGQSFLLIHALNVGDEKQLISTIKNRYEAALKEMFVC